MCVHSILNMKIRYWNIVNVIGYRALGVDCVLFRLRTLSLPAFLIRNNHSVICSLYQIIVRLITY